MGNKLSSKRHRKSSSRKDENIMTDIYNLTNTASNTTSSTQSKSPSDMIGSRRNTFDSQQSYDMNIEHNMHKHHKHRSSIILKMEKIIKPSATAIDNDISEKLFAEELAQKYTLNMLLSGAEQSGKHVIFKQLEQAFKGSIDEQQTKIALNAIRLQIVNDMISLCNLNKRLNSLNTSEEKQQELQYTNKYKIRNSELQQICARVSSLKQISETLSKELAMTLYLLWNDSAIKQTYKKAIDLGILNESSKYFMDKILYIGDKDYRLTFDDYIEIRSAQQHGVSQKQFLIETKYGKYKFNVSQINQQKSQERRWITYLDNIQIFVYVIDISKYNIENHLQNVMDLFCKLCKDPTFKATDFVILFNKTREFKEKIQRIPFNVFGVEHANDSKCIQQCLISKFKEMYKNSIRSIYSPNTQNAKRRNIYFHNCNDSDTQQIGLLLQQIHTDVITTSMKRMGYVL